MNSSPFHGLEWVVLPPGQYEIQLICIDADIEGLKFSLNEINFLPSPGILGVLTGEIKDISKP